MKRRKWLGMMLGAALSLSAAGSGRAQNASLADKEKALAYLETSKKGVLAVTKGLSEAQWSFKPAPDKWSVAECMEHIAAAEDYIRGMIADNVSAESAVAFSPSLCELRATLWAVRAHRQTGSQHGAEALTHCPLAHIGRLCDLLDGQQGAGFGHSPQNVLVFTVGRRVILGRCLRSIGLPRRRRGCSRQRLSQKAHAAFDLVCRGAVKPERLAATGPTRVQTDLAMPPHIADELEGGSFDPFLLVPNPLAQKTEAVYPLRRAGKAVG